MPMCDMKKKFNTYIHYLIGERCYKDKALESMMEVTYLLSL